MNWWLPISEFDLDWQQQQQQKQYQGRREQQVTKSFQRFIEFWEIGSICS